MKTFAVIGQNIDYSISPTIHNAHFKTLNKDAYYGLMNINQLEDEIDVLRTLSGFNVTIPYKEEIYKICDSLSVETQKIGAVNCVKVLDGKFHGYNTDVYGFYQVLKQNDLLNDKKKVLLIGAGGASKAIFYCLSQYTDHFVNVGNRTREKAEALTKNILQLDECSEKLHEFDVVINATNVKGGTSPIEIKKIKDKATFIDINYQDNSFFLGQAQKLNAKTIDGLTMLIYQAARSYEIWFHEKANINAMYQSLRKDDFIVNR